MFEDKGLIPTIIKSTPISIFLFILAIYQVFLYLLFTIYRFPHQIITIMIGILMVIR